MAIDAEYFENHFKERESQFNEKVDEWLKDVVLPIFTQGQGYEIPKWISPDILRLMLEARGFDVTTRNTYQGNFIYLSY